MAKSQPAISIRAVAGLLAVDEKTIGWLNRDSGPDLRWQAVGGFS
jgi:hypothetical protein